MAWHRDAIGKLLQKMLFSGLCFMTIMLMGSRLDRYELKEGQFKNLLTAWIPMNVSTLLVLMKVIYPLKVILSL